MMKQLQGFRVFAYWAMALLGASFTAHTEGILEEFAHILLAAPLANTAPTVANPIPQQSATVGQAFNYVIPANTFTDAETPTQLTLSASGLPSGLSFTAPATISGTPTVSGVKSVTVAATDPDGLSVSTMFTITVSIANTAPTVVNAIPPQSFTIGKGSGFVIPANTFTDAETPNQLTLSVSGLPSGINFTAPNIISGTPSMGGVSMVRVKATDPGGLTAVATFDLTVQTPPTVANAIPSQSATVGQAFSYDIPANTFTDAETPNQLTLSFSGLPSGLSFTAPATISGTPSMSGVSTIRVTATDPTNLSVLTMFTLTVNPTPPVTSLSLTASASPTTILTTGSTTLSAMVSGGTTPYTYTFAGPGTITPSGTTATASGLPAGVQTFTVTAKDATTPTMQTISTIVSVTVNQAPPPNTAPTVANTIPPQSATVGQLFSYVIPANTFTDAETPNQLTLSVSGLPSGLSFTAPGTISGTPSMSGVSTVKVTATDPGSLSVLTTFTITVNPAPPANTAPTVANAIPGQSATAGTAFSYMIPANTFTDAETPNQLTLSVTGLPAGLMFTAPATISGTPSMSGTSNVTVTATDPGGLSASTMFALTVNPAVVNPPDPTGPFAITGVTTVSCTPVAGDANRRQLTFTPLYGGTNGQPISFSVVNELAATTAPGPYTLGVYIDKATLTLSAKQSGTAGEATFVYNWLANCGTTPPANTAPTVANAIPGQSATAGTAFSYMIPANTFTDAETPNQLTLSVTGLPAGLMFTAPATISGTPSMSGTSNVTVTATDPGGLSASTTFALTVNPTGTTPTAPFAITAVTTVSCNPVAGQPNRRQLTFTPLYGGTNGQPISFSVVNELAATTAPGPYTLGVYIDKATLTLSAKQSGTAGEATFVYNWLANCGTTPPANTAPTVANAIPGQAATAGTAFSYLIPANTFTDAETPNQLTLSVSGLPAGLMFTAPATISGTPSMSGTSNVTVTATDPGGFSASTMFALTVNPTGTTPTAPFAITGVTTVSCNPVAGQPNRRSLTFTPQYSGVNGQPISFSVVNELSPSTAPGPYTLGVYVDKPTLTLSAVQTGTAGEANFVYNWLANCGTTPPTPEPTGAFAITAVTTVSCNPVAGQPNRRQLTFTPLYGGTNGQPISFSVVNELAPTTAPGPYTLGVYVDKPTITLSAVQTGSPNEATFVYNWLAVCNSGSGRLGAEPGADLQVQVMGNPVVGGQVSLSVRGAIGQALNLTLTDLRGQVVGAHEVPEAGAEERHSFDISQQPKGLLLLRVSTPTESKTIKVVKGE